MSTFLGFFALLGLCVLLPLIFVPGQGSILLGLIGTFAVLGMSWLTYPATTNTLFFDILYPILPYGIIGLVALIAALSWNKSDGKNWIARFPIIIGCIVTIVMYYGLTGYARYSSLDIEYIDQPVKIDLAHTVVTQNSTAQIYMSQSLGSPSFNPGEPEKVYGLGFHGHVSVMYPNNWLTPFDDNMGFYILKDGETEAKITNYHAKYGSGKYYDKDSRNHVGYLTFNNLTEKQFFTDGEEVTTLIPSVKYGLLPLYPTVKGVYSVRQSGETEFLSLAEAAVKFEGGVFIPRTVADKMLESFKYRSGFKQGLFPTETNFSKSEEADVVTLVDGEVGYLYPLKYVNESNRALVYEVFINGATGKVKVWDATQSQIIAPNQIESRAIGLLSGSVWARGKGGVSALDIQAPHEVSLGDGKRAYLAQITPTSASTILAWLLVEPTNDGFGVQVIDRLADVSAALDSPSFLVTTGFEAPEGAINLGKTTSSTDSTQILAEMQRLEALIKKLQESVDAISAQQ
jgi:hypothetical protein